MPNRSIGRRTFLEGGLATALTAAMLREASAQGAPNPWKEVASMPIGAGEMMGAVADGKFYAMTGLGPGFRPLGLVLEYDPATNRWARKSPMPAPAHHVALASLNDMIYGFGGFVPPSSGPPAFVPIAKAWAYDPKAESWRNCAPLPSPLGAAAATVLGGKIYVIGGAGVPKGARALRPRSPQSVSAEVHVYDPVADSWRRGAPMPTARNHLAVAAVGHKIFAIGGRIGGVFIPFADDLDIVEAYDPVADRWGAPLERMPTARSGMAWGVYGDRIYVAGGEYQRLGEFAAFNAVEAFDPIRNRWHIIPPMNHPRHGFAGGVVGDRFFVAGGEAQSGGNGVRAETAGAEALDLKDV